MAEDPTLARFVVRALGDAGLDKFAARKSTAPASVFVSALASKEPRTKLEAIVAVSRQNLIELAPQIAASLGDADLLSLRAGLDAEMRKRRLAFSVGQVGEQLAIAYFKSTSGLTTLQLAPAGTKNVDALSRNGERFSIKTVCNAKKTGTIYPDSEDTDKQLFEYLLVVQLSNTWTLKSIHQLTWAAFCEVRSWDKRMNAWYVAISGRALAAADVVFQAEKVADV